MSDEQRQTGLTIRLADQALADDIEGWLAEAGADDVSRDTESGFGPISLPIIIVATVVAGVAVDILMRIRDKTGCLLVIDARSDDVKTEVDCDDRHGRLVVLTKEGTKVEIKDVPAGVDLTAIGKAALEGGAEAVKEAAKAIGATVSDQPADAER